MAQHGNGRRAGGSLLRPTGHCAAPAPEISYCVAHERNREGTRCAASVVGMKVISLATVTASGGPHIDGEDFAVYSHGAAERLVPTEPDWHEIIDHWTQYYGQSPLTVEDDVVMWRLRPHWLVGYAADQNDLFAGGHDSAPATAVLDVER